MSIVADTSVLVAAMVEAHPAHARALDWFDRELARKGNLHVCAHSLAELYAVLTRLPLKPRISPDAARRLISENIEKSGVIIVELNTSDYCMVLDQMAAGGFQGGMIYDALVVRTALNIRAAGIVTLNESDFIRLCSKGAPAIVSP